MRSDWPAVMAASAAVAVAVGMPQMPLASASAATAAAGAASAAPISAPAASSPVASAAGVAAPPWVAPSSISPAPSPSPTAPSPAALPRGAQAASAPLDITASPAMPKAEALFSLNGTVVVINGTISANRADQGGRGIFVIGFNGSATLQITSSIIGQSDTATSDVSVVGGYQRYTNGKLVTTPGSVAVSGQTNLIRTIASAGSVTNSLTGTLTADPLLDTLRNNGGRTPTMALLVGSPAFDAGPLSGSTFDQLGMPRVGNPDIGAFENPVAGTFVVNTASDVINSTDNKLSLREAIGLANGTLRLHATFHGRKGSNHSHCRPCRYDSLRRRFERQHAHVRHRGRY